MNRRRHLFLIILLAASLPAPSQELRKPVFAGSFYDGDKGRLSAQIDMFLNNVKSLPVSLGEIQGLICPHAGYVYSGQTAAYSYRLIQNKPYEAVIVIAPSHQYGFEGCSIFLRGGFETPLGIIRVDEALAEEIAEVSGFSYLPQAHAKEHAVEVQIPFIQKTLPQAKIVPIVMGYPTRKTVNALAEALAQVLPSKKALLIASTDLSHYLARKGANETDARTISLIQNLKTDTLINKMAWGENIMCGGGPVAALLLALKKKGSPRVEILRYSDSSEVSGDLSRVVGYLAAAVTIEGPAAEFFLSEEEKKELLTVARQAIENFVKENKVLEHQTQSQALITEKGAFVTLKKKGVLRGCIGFIEPIFPLYQTVIRTAIYAATQDSRFPPLSGHELEDLEVEISVLTPLQKIEDPRSVVVGKHGLVIVQGTKKGLLLPQVAVENRWSRQTFLDQACLKAGLPAKAWKNGAEIYVFEAIVFP